MAIISDTPVLDTLAAITADSVERCGLDDNSLLTARIAALVAVDAPAASYLAHIGPAADAGVTLEQVQGILIAVAPIVGTPRTVSAAAKITKALGDRHRRGRSRARRRAGRSGRPVANCDAGEEVGSCLRFDEEQGALARLW